MTVIYADTLFLLNALVDYLLLLASARVAGEPLRRLRFAAGGVLGGAYAVSLFLPAGAFLIHPLCRCGVLALMLVAAYGGSRRLLRQSLIFLALSCALAGGILGVELLDGQRMALAPAGVIYTGLDLKMVLLAGAVCYVLLGGVFRRAGAHTRPGGELVDLRLTLGERSILLVGLLDTGNTLTDPVSGCPVPVAEGERLVSLLPPGCRPDRKELSDPAGALERLGGEECGNRFRLLPYRAVGVDRGLLLALRLDRAEADGRKLPSTLVALSPTPVSDGGGYQVLVGRLGE